MCKARFVYFLIFARGSDRKQTVLLTGASEGMGRSVAKQLAAKGANVVIVSRNVGKLEEALAEVKVTIPLLDL